LDMTWKGGKLAEARVKNVSNDSGICRVLVGKTKRDYAIDRGETAVISP
jgi:hypothetical protein